MNAGAGKRRLWMDVAWILGLLLVIQLAVPPLWRAMSAGAKQGFVLAAAIGLAGLLVMLVRATLRD